MNKLVSALLLVALDRAGLHVFETHRLSPYLILDAGTHCLLIYGIEKDRHDKNDDNIGKNAFQHALEDKPLIHKGHLLFLVGQNVEILVVFCMQAKSMTKSMNKRRGTALFVAAPLMESFQNSTREEA